MIVASDRVSWTFFVLEFGSTVETEDLHLFFFFFVSSDRNSNYYTAGSGRVKTY